LAGWDVLFVDLIAVFVDFKNKIGSFFHGSGGDIVQRVATWWHLRWGGFGRWFLFGICKKKFVNFLVSLI
jgi:hypothetical protein